MNPIEELEQKLHAVLTELETKLQSLFGSHPKIAEHVATAKQEASAALFENEANAPARTLAPEANPPIPSDHAGADPAASTPASAAS